MPDSNKVVRYGRNEFVQHEETADGSAVDTGMLLEETANGVQPHSTADGAPSKVLVALDARERGMELGDQYPAGSLVKYVKVSGGGAHMPLAAGETVADGDDLTSNGDGALAAMNGDGTSTATGITADEDLDNSGASEAAYVAVDF